MSMESIIEDMYIALDAGAHYAALCVAVTLPEICGRCELEDGFSMKGANRSQEIFQRFVDSYLPDWDIGLTGADLFYLRNGLSHRGQTNKRNTPFRYVFAPPRGDNSVLHNNRSHRAGKPYRLMIDLAVFCNDIATAVRQWECDNSENELVLSNLESVLQKREGDVGTGIHIDGYQYLA